VALGGPVKGLCGLRVVGAEGVLDTGTQFHEGALLMRSLAVGAAGAGLVALLTAVSPAGFAAGADLLQAAKTNDVERVRQFLGSGASAKAKNEEGWTALHVAAFYGSLEVAQLLLDSGADVNATGNDGGTPLYVAAAQGRLELAQLLLAHGAEVNAKTALGQTPLHAAAWGGHLPTVKLLVGHGANVRAKDKAGMTPIRLAAVRDWPEVVKLLLARGATPGPWGFLSTAAEHGAGGDVACRRASLLVWSPGADALLQRGDGFLAGLGEPLVH